MLCLQQDRRTENRELNCQVCQSANGCTMGPTSLGFNQLPATASNLVITTPRTSRIYFLLRIHKRNNPGRPIVSAYGWAKTNLLSLWRYISGLQTSFDLSSVKEPSSKTLLRLAKLVLTLNCLSIADSSYKEINTVANRYQNGTQLRQLFRRLDGTPIF